MDLCERLAAAEKEIADSLFDGKLSFKRTVEVGTMSNHASASLNSKYLCERLFEALEKKLGPLTYEQGKKGCSIRGSGSVFAWVNSHARNYGSIDIWFLGSAGDAIGFTGLTIYKRPPAGKPYGGRFNIRDKKQIEEAVKLLSTVSFPKS